MYPPYYYSPTDQGYVYNNYHPAEAALYQHPQGNMGYGYVPPVYPQNNMPYAGGQPAPMMQQPQNYPNPGNNDTAWIELTNTINQGMNLAWYSVYDVWDNVVRCSMKSF